jgi:hypothetical protein
MMADGFFGRPFRFPTFLAAVLVVLRMTHGRGHTKNVLFKGHLGRLKSWRVYISLAMKIFKHFKNEGGTFCDFWRLRVADHKLDFTFKY